MEVLYKGWAMVISDAVFRSCRRRRRAAAVAAVAFVQSQLTDIENTEFARIRQSEQLGIMYPASLVSLD